MDEKKKNTEEEKRDEKNASTLHNFYTYRYVKIKQQKWREKDVLRWEFEI